ncbi:type VII toxin-antitoxin system MntA family adenylyltransferase antitoxin [Clostridium sp.]|uniref:type VII toxin-antitoxin system MntA family adenylyltransferase antitoxin n=1 Tax=Clostridium sp. TaxID=1506 RepID=UPI003D6D9487
MSKLYGKDKIIENLNSKEVTDFINKNNITTLVMFGSITNDDFNQESDVDLALLADKEIELENILDLELLLENLLNREIDILDLRSEALDLFVKISILNTGKVVYTKDKCKSLENLYDETDKIYRENENFIHFRKGDVLL